MKLMVKMNILFLTQLDFSSLDESNIYTDLLREFVHNGHQVYVVSPIEKRKNVNSNIIHGQDYSILKLKIGNYQKTNLVEKGITLLLLERSFRIGIQRYFSKVKFDLVLYSTPPITLQSVVKFVKQRDNAKTYLLLKDIFPQNAIDLEMFSKLNPIYWYFRRKEKSLYRNSDFIGCMSRANVDYVIKHNADIKVENVEVCPNSMTVSNYDVSIDKSEMKLKFGFPLNKTIYVYGGNFGKPQGIDFFIKCLDILRADENNHIVLAGSGTQKHKIVEYVDSIQSKQSNVSLLKEMKKVDFDDMIRCCDIGLVFLDYRFTIPNFPSRLLSYMNASLPILAVTDKTTDVGNVIEDGGFGVWCESNDLDGFKEKTKYLSNPVLRNEMGRKSRSYLEKNYTSSISYSIIMKHFQ